MAWTRTLRLGLAAVMAATSTGALTAAPGAASVQAGRTWGTAITVSGIATLNNGNSQVVSMSCAASADCAAVGTYQRSGDRIFVADENGGSWGSAEEFAGMATLNKGKFVAVSQVSCGKPGDCVTGGEYTDASNDEQGWLASETGGVWHAAHAVSGLAALNQGGAADVTAVSCPAGMSGDCTAAGYYNTAGQANQLGFVISEHSGTWGKLILIPGLSALGGGVSVNSLSCAPGAAGNCALTGSYFGPGLSIQAFVADSASGAWADAEEIPGTAALNAGGTAEGDSVSCPSAGNCSLGGAYSDGSATQGFVAQQSGGVWADAEAIPGLAALNHGGFVNFASLSCGATGDCAAGGFYSAGINPVEDPTFVVAETGGVWGNAEQVPGLPALSNGDFETVDSVSCSSAAQCWVGGSYDTATPTFAGEAFVVNEISGTWHAAHEVPGTAALNTAGNATTFAVSCAPGGSCALGGDYRYSKTGTAGHEQAFVDSQS